MAGKGSGALKRSNQVEGVIANIDIGGGTANVALFQNGRTIQTITFNIGGRLIRLNEDGKIGYISDHLHPWLQANNFLLEIGGILTFPKLKEITNRMNDSMLSYLTGSPKHSAELLLLDSQPTVMFPIDEIIISGGIGEMMRTEPPFSMKDVASHGDMGPQLSHSLINVARSYSFVFKEAIETTRATVIGAGMQNTEVSGATIYVNKALLPIKNIPILSVPVETNNRWEQDTFQVRLRDTLKIAGRLYGDRGDEPPFAIALSETPYCTYEILQVIAASIFQQYRIHFPHSNCLVILCETDIAKALGQAIAKTLPWKIKCFVY